MSGPIRRDRPSIPDYGVPDTDEGLLEWPWARDLLERTLTYWLATTRPDGRPHSIPIWGVWLDDAFWFEGGAEVRWARSIAADPRAVMSVHVDDDTAIIVEGVTESRLDPAAELSARLVAGYGKYLPTRHAYQADPANWTTAAGGGLWVLLPVVAMAWTDFPRDCTRWHFG